MESNDDYDMVYSNYYIFHQDKKNLSNSESNHFGSEKNLSNSTFPNLFI